MKVRMIKICDNLRAWHPFHFQVFPPNVTGAMPFSQFIFKLLALSRDNVTFEQYSIKSIPEQPDSPTSFDFEVNVISALPISTSKLEQFQSTTQADSALQQLMQLTMEGWPDHKSKVPTQYLYIGNSRNRYYLVMESFSKVKRL